MGRRYRQALETGRGRVLMEYGRWHPEQGRRARVEIMPLIDVMFLLLCFFVYASVNMVIQRGITVDLASARTGAYVDAAREMLTLSVNAEGAFFIDRREVTAPTLVMFLTEMKTSGEAKVVVVNADKDARHEDVVTLLDAVTRSGVESVVFAVQPADAE